MFTSKTTFAALAVALALGLSACGGGDDDPVAGPEPAPQPEPGPAPAPVARTAFFTVEVVVRGPGANQQPLPLVYGPDPAAAVRIALGRDFVSVEDSKGLTVQRLPAGPAWSADRQDKLVREFEERLLTFESAQAQARAAGAAPTSRTQQIAGFDCTVWANADKPELGEWCITDDDISLLRRVGVQAEERVVWLKKGEPDAAVTAIPRSYADDFGPGEDNFQIASTTRQQAVLSGVQHAQAPQVRAGLAGPEAVPGLTQAWRMLRFDGSKRSEALYAICLTATVTAVDAHCLQHNGATSGPVALSKITFVQGRPPSGALWQAHKNATYNGFQLRSASNTNVLLSIGSYNGDTVELKNSPNPADGWAFKRL